MNNITIKLLLLGLMASIVLALTADYSHLLIWVIGYDWQYDDTTTAIVRWTVYTLNAFATSGLASMCYGLSNNRLMSHKMLAKSASGLWIVTTICLLVLHRPGFWTNDAVMLSSYIIFSTAAIVTGLALLGIEHKAHPHVQTLVCSMGFASGLLIMAYKLGQGYSFIVSRNFRMWIRCEHHIFVGYLFLAATIALLIYITIINQRNDEQNTIIQ